MVHRRAAIGLAALALAGLSAGPAAFAQQQQSPLRVQQQARKSVYDVLMSDRRFVTTMKMVYMTGSGNRLEKAGPLTVFAATDQAWDAGNYGGLLSTLGSTSGFPDSSTITGLLRGFFVRGEPTRAQPGDVRMRSTAGRLIEFDPGSMTVKWVDADGGRRSAKVSGQPIMASNGVIYPVDVVVGS